MSIVVDSISSESNTTSLEAPQESNETVDSTQDQSIQTETSVPDKYKGKSIEDVIAMHQNAEKALGKRGQEIGEHRKLIESLLSEKTVATKNTKETEIPQEDQNISPDFYEDPASAVKFAIDNHPDIQQARLDRELSTKELASSKLELKHPDFKDIVEDTGFQEWIESSEIRKELFLRADNYDYNSADELFSTWKKLNLLDKTKQVKEEEEQKRIKALRQTSSTGRSSGDSVGGKKIYRRSDLINLQVTDPARYANLADEIQQAYAEGRVK